MQWNIFKCRMDKYCASDHPKGSQIIHIVPAIWQFGFSLT